MKLPLIVVCALLAGCVPEPKPPTNAFDQCLRRVVFQECMHSLPAGHQSTRYNDWDDVVESCSDVAKWQSLRKIEHVKPECIGE